MTPLALLALDARASPVVSQYPASNLINWPLLTFWSLPVWVWRLFPAETLTDLQLCPIRTVEKTDKKTICILYCDKSYNTRSCGSYPRWVRENF